MEKEQLDRIEAKLDKLMALWEIISKMTMACIQEANGFCLVHESWRCFPEQGIIAGEKRMGK